MEVLLYHNDGGTMMRPVIYSSSALTQLFDEHKVLTGDKIMSALGCSNMTTWRLLNAIGYLTSYNFNARYYTLLNIPKFDEHGLWSHRKVRFSKCGALTKTIKTLVLVSVSGLTMPVLRDMLQVNITPTLLKLHRQEEISRQKVGPVYLYLNSEAKARQLQLTKHEEAWQKAKKCRVLPEPDRIIAVLVELIKTVDLEPDQVYRRLRDKGLRITKDELRLIWSHFDLVKKKAFELMKLRSDLLTCIHGPLPDYCSLPDLYILDVVPERDRCDCGNVLRKYRTKYLFPTGLMVGKPTVRHHIKQCSLCKQTYQCEQLAELKPLYGNYSFDLIVEIGRDRFCRYKQNQEIAAKLAHHFGLNLPLSTISDLAGTFLDYIAAIHEAHTPTIRDKITTKGGYILHLDGTCEAGTDVLFVALDGHTKWILDSCKIQTENVREITLFLRRVTTRYGKPLAIVSDMSPHIAQAIHEVLPRIPHFICHYHFLVNVGERLCQKPHSALIKVLRSKKIFSSLRSLRKDMKKYIKKGELLTGHDTMAFLDDPNLLLNMEPLQAQRYLAFLLLNWLNDYGHDLKGEYFPFDLSSLAFYRRGLKIGKALDTVLSQCHLNKHEWQTIQTINRHLQPLRTAGDIRNCAKRLEKAERLFIKLRKILRLTAVKNGPVLRQNQLRPSGYSQNIEERTAKFRLSLQKTIDHNRDADRRKDTQIVMTYLDKYWEKLFGHVVYPDGQDEPVAIQRTNNIVEHQFSSKKRKLRRKVGNKKLTRNIQAMRAEELLAENLEDPEYVELIYGSAHNMVAQFAKHRHQVYELRKKNQKKKTGQLLIITKKTLRKKDFLNKLAKCTNHFIQNTFMGA